MNPPATPTATDTDRSVASDAAARPRNPTRVSGLWIAVVGFALLLLILAIFLLQNGQRVQIDYLGTNSRLPLAVAMLLSAVAGALLVAAAGAARVLQLRRFARTDRQANRH